MSPTVVALRNGNPTGRVYQFGTAREVFGVVSAVKFGRARQSNLMPDIAIQIVEAYDGWHVYGIDRESGKFVVTTVARDRDVKFLLKKVREVATRLGGKLMFVRLFKQDGSYVDGELEYKDLGAGVNEDGEPVEKYEMTFKPGLPQGILPTKVMRMEWEDEDDNG